MTIALHCNARFVPGPWHTDRYDPTYGYHEVYFKW